MGNAGTWEMRDWEMRDWEMRDWEMRGQTGRSPFSDRHRFARFPVNWGTSRLSPSSPQVPRPQVPLSPSSPSSNAEFNDARKQILLAGGARVSDYSVIIAPVAGTASRLCRVATPRVAEDCCLRIALRILIVKIEHQV